MEDFSTSVTKWKFFFFLTPTRFLFIGAFLLFDYSSNKLGRSMGKGMGGGLKCFSFLSWDEVVNGLALLQAFLHFDQQLHPVHHHLY